MITARVVADTTYEHRRVLTLSCDYPRFIHPQVMTYGMIRKSTSSSRAIPVKRQLELSEEHAFIPAALAKNQPGMGATESIDEAAYAQARSLIAAHLQSTRALIEQLAALGVHKQHANRYLEPYLMTRCMMTGAYEAFQHLIKQRKHDNVHGAVQPEMYELACTIDDAINASTPKIARWHVPYFTGTDPRLNDALYAIARAARDSYMREDVSTEFMSKLQQLWDEGHLGPFEHVAYFDFTISTGPLVLPHAMSAGQRIGHSTDQPLLTDLYGWRTVRHIGLDKLSEWLEL